MLTASEQYRILDSAEALYKQHDYRAVAELLSKVSLPKLLTEPSLGYLLSAAWSYMGRERRALRLVRQLAKEGRTHGNTFTNRRLHNLWGTLLLSGGSIDDAEQLFYRVLSDSISVKDQLMAAAVTMNLGVVANIRCEWKSALSAYERAAAAFYALGQEAIVGHSHHNKGMAYRQLGYFTEADSEFERALACAVSTRSAESITQVEIERALLTSLCDDQQLAQKNIERALGRARLLGNLSLEGDALRVLGVVACRQQLSREAEIHLCAALTIARKESYRLLEAESLEELAKLYHQKDDNERARRFASQAAAVYGGMRASAHVQRIQDWILSLPK